MQCLIAIANTSHLCMTEQNPQSGLPKVQRRAVDGVRVSNVDVRRPNPHRLHKPIRLGAKKRFNWKRVMAWLGR